MTHTYSIKGMTCGNCAAKVTSALLKMENIETAEVQLTAPQAVLTMKSHIATNGLQAAISKAGNYTIEEADSTPMHHVNGTTTIEDSQPVSYLPIVLIFAYITGVTLLVQVINGGFDPMQWMRHFMAGFFLVFSFFKIMNLRGFAEGYSTYDIVARRVFAWGFIYPFVELVLGLAFLSGLFSLGINIAAFVVMGVSSIGVVNSLVKKLPFQCACLGTVIKLPLSKVTLFEDLLMAAMSIISIIMFI